RGSRSCGSTRYTSLMMPAATQPIRLAFLGADHTTSDLAQAAIDSNRFTLAGICEFDLPSGTTDESLRALSERSRRLDHWEALLDQQRVDAAVVARGPEDLRAEQLRKLIQLGVPLLVSHPVVDSMLVYYELDMIRRETDCVVLPYLPARHHPAARRLAEIV